MVNWASLVVEWGMIWYDHYISWSKLAHNLLALSNFFLITFKITLFVEFACTLDYGCKTETKFVCTPNLGKNSMTTMLSNYVILSETMTPDILNLHMIIY